MSGQNPTQQSDDRPPTWLELESVKPLPEAEQRTSLSEDTLKRKYRHWIVQLSDRRVGMKLRHILEIARGRGTAA